MSDFVKADARAWAREHMRGCTNVLMASYTDDLGGLNEAAVRHDVRRNIELGFAGALIVSETAMTVEEYLTLCRWIVDESDGQQVLLHQASFNTLEENIAVAKQAADLGISACLLSYPSSFYPRTSEEIYDHTAQFCAAVDMGVVLFPVGLWGFERLHPASIDPQILCRLVADVPNVVAIKAEGGLPSVACFAQLTRLVGDEVLISMPIEDQGIPLATLVDTPWMGTSNMEYFGSAIPEMFELIRQGRPLEALDRFWAIAPARAAARTTKSAPGANVAHRMVWKYMAWLNGYNGGPLRMPTMRIVASQMRTLRAGLVSADLPVADGDDGDFFVGRIPAHG